MPTDARWVPRKPTAPAGAVKSGAAALAPSGFVEDWGRASREWWGTGVATPLIEPILSSSTGQWRPANASDKAGRPPSTNGVTMIRFVPAGITAAQSYQTMKPVTSKNIGKNHVKTGKLYASKGVTPKAARRPQNKG